MKRDETTPMTQLVLRAAPPDQAVVGGKYRLVFGDKLRIWASSDRTGTVVSGQTEFDISQDTTLFLEGLARSTSIGGEKVALKWVKGDDAVIGDTVRLTVVEAEFQIETSTFIPDQWLDVPVFGGIDQGDDRPPPSGFQFLPLSFRGYQRVFINPFAVLDADGLKDEPPTEPPPPPEPIRCTPENQSGPRLNCVGQSVGYDKTSSVPFPDEGYSDNNRLFAAALAETCDLVGSGAQYKTGCAYTLDPREIDMEARSSDRTITVRLSGSIRNPLIPIPPPAIDWTFFVTVDSTNPLKPQWKIEGTQDGFPAFEAWIGDSNGPPTLMYQAPPDSRGPLICLPDLICDVTLEIPPGEIP